MDKEKIVIYLVPHTHWDREWYFSKDTADILLNQNIKELIHNIKKNDKMFLDGQWSLLDDYLKSNNDDKYKIIKLLSNKNISSGPLYTQPDVINSLGETILRNFSMGDKIAKSLGVKNNKVAYLPDTFGFNKNFINILKHAKYKYFIFWRGISKDALNISLLNNWKNDNTKIISYCLKNGYFSLGSYYPYNNNSLIKKKWDPKKNTFITSKSEISPINFANEIRKHIKQYKGFNNKYILPLGGDQAPFMINQGSFLKLVKKELNEFDLKIVQNYDDFFANLKTNKIPTYEKDLIYPITGKIHRTISSSRYDIKKLFRDAEEKLYKLLEPLEIYYRGVDNNYDFNQYKDENILKPLFIAQAHDSLGTCNTDSTNKLALNRLNRIHESIDSQIDLLIKKIAQLNNWVQEEIIIFNPSPFTNNISKVMIMYSENHKLIDFNSNNISIRTLNSENISFSDKYPIYKLKVAISVTNLKSLSINKFIIKNKIIKKVIPKSVLINNDEINILNNKITFSAIENKGDSYDFSPGKKLNITQKHIIIYSDIINNKAFYQIESTLKIKKINQKFIWEIFLDNNDADIKIITLNKFKDLRLSLVFINKKAIWSSINMGRYDFLNEIISDNWKENMVEYPVNVGHNDGFINLGDINLITSGNNEFFIGDNNTEITLYKTHNFVTNKNLSWRPTNSGLNWYENAPDSQLKKELIFEFRLSKELNANKLINKSKFKPYIYKNHKRNFIANKMSRFIINDIPKKSLINKIPKISFNKMLVLESLRIENKDLLFRFSNLNNIFVIGALNINDEKYSISLKANEIKLLRIKGIY